MTGPVAVSIVGTGAITSLVHLPVLKALPDCRVAWLADASDAAARRTAAAFGVGPVVSLGAAPGARLDLPPCDLALLAVPLFARAPYLRYFAARGTAVLTEKPFAVTGAEHRMYRALFGATTRVDCGYMRRTYAVVRTLALAVEQGWFGPLRRIRYAEGARTTATAGGTANLDRPHHEGGGVLRDLGCHGIDVIGAITGQPAWAVAASRIAWDGATDREVDARIVLTGVGGDPESRCDVDFGMSWISDQPNSIELEFDRVTLGGGLRPESRTWIVGRDGVRRDLAVQLPGARTSYQAFGLQWQAVLAAYRGAGPSGFEADSSLWTTELVAALYAAGGAP